MALSRGIAACLLAGAPTVICAPALALPTQDPVAPGASATSTPATVAPAAPATAPVQVRGGVKVPDFATQAWVLADLDTGEVLAQANPHLKLRPASTQKLLTAITVAPRLHPDQLYRADKADEVAEGNRVVLYDGLTYKVSDLLHAALLPSANDAAMALAKANGGAARTVAQMNEEAARLGATDTTAVNPSGLDADGQFTSAHDLAVIGRAAFSNPEIAAYLKLAVVDFPGKAKGKASDDRVIYPIYNHNVMLRDGFKGALGGKSGYTTLARRTFVAAGERDGRRLIVSLLNIGGNTYRTGEQLLNWGFAHRDELTAVDALPEPSAPPQAFERSVVPLPDHNADNSGDVGGETFAVVPEQDQTKVSPVSATHSQPGSGAGWPSLLLTLATILMGLVVVARARVYWQDYRSSLRRPVTRRPRNRTPQRTARSRTIDVRAQRQRTSAGYARQGNSRPGHDLVDTHR